MTHKEWLKKMKNPRFKESIIRSIEETGALLELRASKILSKYNYYCRSGPYADRNNNGEEVIREIDVVANSKGSRKIVTGLKDFDIHARIHIIADCKFSSKKDLLVFEIGDEIKPNTSVRIPLFTNGETFNYHIHGNTITYADFQKFFPIPIFSKKIVDVNQSGDKLKIVEREKATNFFRSCESQLLPALLHYYKRWHSYTSSDIYNLWGINFQSSFESLLSTGKIQKKDALTKTISSFNLKYLRGHVPINIFIPMIILSDDIGLLRVVPKKGEPLSIDGLEEIGYCIYLHSPSNVNKFEPLLKMRYEQAILVCNENYLDECMVKLGRGVNMILSEMERNIKKHPNRIKEELEKWFVNFI